MFELFRSRFRSRWTVAIVAASAATGLVGSDAPAQAATVSADFGAREHPRLKVGFLHNLTSASPTDELLLPVHPTAWRSNERSA